MKPSYKRENIRILRKYLGLTQKKFADRFLRDKNGVRTLSYSRLSEIERKGGDQLNEVVLAVAEVLPIEVIAFCMPPEKFLEKITFCLSDDKYIENFQKKKMRKGKSSKTLNHAILYLAEEILEDHLKKGGKIISDRRLAEKLNTGRSAVREALAVLGAFGLIESSSGQGIYLCNKEMDFLYLSLAWPLLFNGDRTRDIIEVRNLIEIESVRLVSANLTNQSLGKLRKTFENIRYAYQCQDYQMFLDSDRDFHLCIAECSGNPVIFHIRQTISSLMCYMGYEEMITAEWIEKIYKEHQKIYECILDENADDASAAMKEHLENCQSRVRH